MKAKRVTLEIGYRKGDINNIPILRNETILTFVSTVKKDGIGIKSGDTNKDDWQVDYVQVKKSVDICDARCLVFSASNDDIYNDDSYANVTLRVDENNDQILESTCDQCQRKELCPHIFAFIFWLHRQSNDNDVQIIRNYWGGLTEPIADEEHIDTLRVRDLYPCDELRLEADLQSESVSEDSGEMFLKGVFDEIEKLNIVDTALYRHCRPMLEEFEPLYVHHTMLDASNNGVNDTRTFILHMEDQAKQGLVERLLQVSKSNYKTQLWYETQFMRIRCSLIHRIASRRDAAEDEHILDVLFGERGDENVDERQQLKQHKRFILKQTEKLENKTYQECGLLLNESYPYICASPDGITDDHIVEIKAPKTDEEFEKYLEGRETIAPKYMAQIQIQMYMANVTKALYCVLSPTFDINGALHYVWVQADMEFVASLLGAAEDFWKDVVFPRLSKIYLDVQ